MSYIFFVYYNVYVYDSWFFVLMKNMDKVTCMLEVQGFTVFFHLYILKCCYEKELLTQSY